MLAYLLKIQLNFLRTASEHIDEVLHTQYSGKTMLEMLATDDFFTAPPARTSQQQQQQHNNNNRTHCDNSTAQAQAKEGDLSSSNVVKVKTTTSKDSLKTIESSQTESDSVSVSTSG